jgi:hypothetical protein
MVAFYSKMHAEGEVEFGSLFERQRTGRGPYAYRLKRD